MKINRLFFRMIPEGNVKEAMRSLYYRLYYNRKRSRENGFYVYYKKGVFEYRFKNDISFLSCVKVEGELKRSLKGYVRNHEIKSGEVVIDCGADVGEFTLYAAKKVGGSGRVVAFEPDLLMYDKLKLNIQLNRLDNVTIVNKGVWSNKTVLKFINAEKKFIEAESDPKPVLTDDNDMTGISVVSLDEELKSLGVDKIDFIKRDVEGSEIEAVTGAEDILKNNNPDLAIASYHEIGGEKTCIKLEEMLRGLGYTAETSYPQHLTTYASKRGRA